MSISLECAPDGGQIASRELTGTAGLSEDESHGQAPHPALSSSVRSPENTLGARPHALAKRHDLSRNLVRIWVAKYEAGAFEDDVIAAGLLQGTKRRSPLWSAWWAASP